MINPYLLARPLLFGLDPERAHELTLGNIDLMARSGLLGLVAGRPADDPVELMGLRFSNRVGLAAGLDKNGAHIDALAGLGFGFIEVGTVTPRPQPGNPRPRMFRLPAAEALINRLGVNNEGVDALVARLDGLRFRGVLGLNIGKNASTPLEHAVDDYLYCLDRVYAHAGYVTVNISSPNTADLRRLQGGDELSRLLADLSARRQALADQHGRHVPLVVKIAPDLDDEQVATIADLLPIHGIDGVIATNTTIARDQVKGLRHGEETGGLSGRPVFEASNAVIRGLRRRLPTGFPIIGVGGIMSAHSALAKIEAGADLVQLYTGLIYQGPQLVGDTARLLARRSQRKARANGR